MSKRDCAVDDQKVITAWALRETSSDMCCKLGCVGKQDKDQFYLVQSGFASLNTLKNIRVQGNFFVYFIENGHSGKII